MNTPKPSRDWGDSHTSHADTPVGLVEELERTLNSWGHFSEFDFSQYIVPAAVIGYFPESLLGVDAQPLRTQFERVGAVCNGMWVERIAGRYGLDPLPLKKLWRLADDDRETELLSKIRRAADRAAALAQIRSGLDKDYLGTDRKYSTHFSTTVSEREYRELKCSFVRSWLKSHLQIRAEEFPDDEQIAAIASVSGAVQVTARAGSGKTTTLVRRTIFLIRHCKVAPSAILLLAFNRAAALNMRRALLLALYPAAKSTFETEIRVGSKGPGNKVDREIGALQRTIDAHQITMPNVMTFHALAYGLVNPQQSLLIDNGTTGELGLSRAFQDVIDGHLRDPAWQHRIRSLMLLHFRHDWDSIERGGYDQSPAELISHRRSLPRESLAGEYVKSFGEKVIADFLLEHGVPYRYERNHRWDGFNYRPDFTLFRTTGKAAEGAVIEYFGLAGDVDYDKSAERKRAYWKQKSHWDFLEFTPRDLHEGLEPFRSRLLEQLRQVGFACRKLSEGELWELVKQRAIDRFTRAIAGFIGRCRKQLIDPDTLQDRIAVRQPLCEAEEQFTELALDFYRAYLASLAMSDTEDFDGVMQRAISLVESGQSLVRRGQEVVCDLAKIRFLCIDEFQDFSELFYRLVVAIRRGSDEDNCFCVGDDWQAINGFAGSDLKYFDHFAQYMGPSTQLAISTNYRSTQRVVEAGNAVMESHGIPAIARSGASMGSITMGCMDKFDASLIEQKRHSGDDITAAVLRLTSDSVVNGREVVMLCRTNSVPWYINWDSGTSLGRAGIERFRDHVRSFLPEHLQAKVTASTTHKYKGLEKDDVIILDAVARSYPLVHPDWVFSRVLGVSIDDLVSEDLRLFYVAVTRARNSLTLITETGAESPFLKKIQNRIRMEPFSWEKYQPPSGDAKHFILRVENRPGCKVTTQQGSSETPTYVLRESLKMAGFHFRSVGTQKYWEKLVIAEHFRIEEILDQAWAREADGIELRLLDSSSVLLKSWSLNRGTAKHYPHPSATETD